MTASVKELERAIKELGMIGAMVNPDISRRGTGPTQEEEYWYPLYEAACKLDIPLFIHPGSSALPRHRNYSLALHLGFLIGESEFILTFILGRVFERFSTLKILVSHGGGAIPYQLGRFQASTEPDLRRGRAHACPRDISRQSPEDVLRYLPLLTGRNRVPDQGRGGGSMPVWHGDARHGHGAEAGWPLL